MITFLKKYGLWLAGIAGVLLLIIAFRGCNNLPTHKDEKKTSDSLESAYANKVAIHQMINARLEYQKDSLQKCLDSTNILLSFVRKDASVRIAAVKQTLSAGISAALRKDTAAILVNWDSLRAQVAAGLPVVIAQDSLSQRVIADCLQQGMVKDSLIYSYKGLWMLADSNYAKQRQLYNGLYSDYRKANSRLKFNKTLSRGLAIALLAAGAKIFILK
jgi:hypothetical protein